MIPTAEDFANEYHDGAKWSKIMIDFAKLHVEAALKAASEGDLVCYCDSWESCHTDFPSQDVLHAYPLEIIK